MRENLYGIVYSKVDYVQSNGENLYVILYSKVDYVQSNAEKSLCDFIQ